MESVINDPSGDGGAPAAEDTRAQSDTPSTSNQIGNSLSPSSGQVSAPVDARFSPFSIQQVTPPATTGNQPKRRKRPTTGAQLITGSPFRTTLVNRISNRRTGPTKKQIFRQTSRQNTGMLSNNICCNMVIHITCTNYS